MLKNIIIIIIALVVILNLILTGFKLLSEPNDLAFYFGFVVLFVLPATISYFTYQIIKKSFKNKNEKVNL